MYELQIFLQRRRRTLVRLAVVTVMGLAATLAILPRADARGPAIKAPAAAASLLAPYSLAGPMFSRFYPL